jgi:endonuclease/exonuclease/phosphatase (EEP) superfamily protein YafD
MDIAIFAEIIASGGIILIGIATLAGVLGRWAWQLDLFSHFRVLYLFLLIGFTSLSLILSNMAVSFLGGVFICVNLKSIIPFYFPIQRREPRSKTSRILLSNVLRPNDHYGKLANFIHRTQPDIIVLIEISKAWLQELNPELNGYAYNHIALHYHNFGLALFSRYPLMDVHTQSFSGANVPSIIAKIDIDGSLLSLIATHPPPPKSKQEAIHRNQQLRNIAAFANLQTMPTMLVGDLNLTSWSPFFKELIHESRLRDSRLGLGIQPTWPTDKPLFMIPIDHVLVSEGIIIHDRFTGPVIGSDHRPVIVDFSLENCADNFDNVV